MLDILDIGIKLLSSGGIPIILVAMWWYSNKIWTGQQAAAEERWKRLMEIEAEKWASVFQQISAASSRQHDLNRSLIENNSQQTGLMAQMSTRLEGLTALEKQTAEILREMDKNFRDELRNLYHTINGR